MEQAEKYLLNNPNVQEKPMNLSTISQAFSIQDIPELHNRLIAALGKELAIPVMTNDPIIQKSKKVDCIWE